MFRSDQCAPLRPALAFIRISAFSALTSQVIRSILNRGRSATAHVWSYSMHLGRFRGQVSCAASRSAACRTDLAKGRVTTLLVIEQFDVFEQQVFGDSLGTVPDLA